MDPRNAQGGHLPYPTNLECYQQTKPYVMQTASMGTWTVREPKIPAHVNVRCSVPFDYNWGRSTWGQDFVLPLGVGREDSRTAVKNEVVLELLPTVYTPLAHTLQTWELRRAGDAKLAQFSHQGRHI